ncbi:MAG: 3-methyl-2-oxobutanoate dehydrogenase subunit VorB, partial [Bacteroidales bacterium]|jgi:2-oxoglutarate ferredoxin oxidoreductase subunit alpha
MTSSSSPGISLKMEGISYLAGSELPCLIVNVVRGGPGLGTIQPSQADYFQATKGGGHGDYHLIVLAPSSVQEMSDFVKLGFELALKYRNPAMILSDGMIGQMMEKVELFDPVSRETEFDQSWVATGKTPDRERNIVTSLDLDPSKMEKHNKDLSEKYDKMKEEEVRYEKVDCDDAEYLYVAYGSSARICQKAIKLAREEGIRVGLLRPITLFPFPSKVLAELAGQVKGMLSVELSSGQMVEDVRLAVNGRIPVEHFGRTGGIIHSPEEVLNVLKTNFIRKS